MAAMKSDRKDLVEGLGLCVLALGFGGLFLYGAIAVALDEKYVRAAVYGVLALGALVWGVRMTLGEWARYRGRGNP